MSIVRLAGALLVAPSLACGFVGCSSGGERDQGVAWYDKTIVENFEGRSNPPSDSATAPPSAGAAATVPGGAPPVGVVPPTELYRSETSCGTTLPEPGGPAVSAAPGDIALDMTECEVARRYGPPDKVELGALANGARALTLSYLRVPRPRIYHFTSGRLVAIENFPETPPPARDKRAAHQSR